MTTGFCLPNPISSKNLAVRAPTEGLETAVLWNGQEWKNVTVGLPGVSDVDTTPSKLFKRDDLNCKGSGLCNNLAGGATRSNCLAAYNKIFDSVRYHAGG